MGAALLFSGLDEGKDVTLKAYRPIYYLGCKAAFTDAIKSAIDAVAPNGGAVLDLFAGTGSVAHYLADGRAVITVDIQEYSRVLCSAALRTVNLSSNLTEEICDRVRQEETQIAWSFEPMIAFEEWAIAEALNGKLNDLVDLLESPPLIEFLVSKNLPKSPYFNSAVKETMGRLATTDLGLSESTTVTRNFGGIYFSFKQALTLDAALSVAHLAEDGVRDTLMAASLSTASSIVNTVGKHFAQPIQPRNRAGIIKPGLAKNVFKDRSSDAFTFYRIWLKKYSELPVRVAPHQSVCMDYVEGLKLYGPQCSVVYADPPYTRDHYSRFYHVLETMCLRDNPEVSRVVKRGLSTVSRGVYRQGRHQSPFSIRSAAPAAFEELFRSVRELQLPLVLSYSPHEFGDGTHPRVVSMAHIVELANKYYSKVVVDAVEGVTHNQLNRSGLKLKKREQAEVIIKCFI